MTQRPASYCDACGHSPEGCISTRCDCWLTDEDVREQAPYAELLPEEFTGELQTPNG